MKKQTKKRRQQKKKLISTIIVAAIIAITGGSYIEFEQGGFDFLHESQQAKSSTTNKTKTELANLTYEGNQIVEINGNKTTFTEEELDVNQEPSQTFSDLDQYNRVGEANAVLNKSMMPTEERESLYIDPTGFKNKKISTGWLYNRCHLIGFQLTGENNNIKNLMTGTQSFNTPCMLEYENQVADYLKQTGKNVRYRVTPIFKDDELVARGAQLQAKSMEDDGLEFNVYIFNVQDGVTINYQDGSSKVN
ncbi:DNA/RNA non-specific endonuclease [Listeria costaricensis]|uniref:DNA/RNA non-specific endonuclease n=1 Tax=Listeria costaricensis TaxID=2026604 RepID=UPI000C086489|nr:DNA/RNA non-specific endonuclease [Listeria costaricensis]